MILVILQARTSSTRLPGKVLLDVLGKPMIIRQIERIRFAKNINKLVVATSNEVEDLELVEVCKNNKIEFFCGDLNNVLKRFYDCALQYEPDNIVRLTGDCPLIDPEIIDKVIKLHLDGNFDYTSNVLNSHYPDGLDVEIFNFKSLKISYENAKLESQKEHLTQYILSNKKDFKIGFFYEGKNRSELRWTVDNKEDFDLITKIYQKLYNKNKLFLMKDIVELFESDHSLQEINNKYQRNEGLLKSLQNDKITSI